MSNRSLARLAPLIVLVALAVLSAIGAAPARGASFTVDATHDAVDASPGDRVCADAGGACTLRAAVMETNALAGADEISLPTGTYVLSIPGAGEDASETGDLDVAGDLTISGAGRETTAIDGGGLDRVIHVFESIRMDAENLSLTNGSAGTSAGGGKCNPFAGQENGGGLCNESGVVGLTNVLISGSSATRHGAAIWNAGVLEIESSSITDNLQDAVINGDNFNEGTAMVRATSVSNNGRGLRNYGIVVLNDSVFNENLNGVENWGGMVTMNGGQVNGNDQFGLVNFGDTMTLSNVTVRANGSLGILNEMPGALVVVESTISNNAGGGVSSSVGQPIDTPVGPGTLEMTNSTVSGNLQGGIITGGHMGLVNVTIAHNTGAGLSRVDRSYPLATTLQNTLVGDNSGADCDGGPGFTSLGSNLDTDGTCGLNGPRDIGNGYAGLLPLSDNGGPTQTNEIRRLFCYDNSDVCDAASEAIDAADPAACPATDQRGQPRPFDGDGDGVAVCDIGAYEQQQGPRPCQVGCGNVQQLTPTPTSPPGATPAVTPSTLPATGGSAGSPSAMAFALAAAAVVGVGAAVWRVRRPTRR
jgi:Right handed beta helix region